MSTHTTLTQISETIDVTIEELDTIIKDFHSKFKENVTIQTVTEAVIILMQQIGKISKLNGNDKKFLVTKLLIHIVNETDSGSLDEILDAILLNIIPILIDNLISVENGNLIFNPKIKKRLVKLFSCKCK
jgi:hypothetical protein